MSLEVEELCDTARWCYTRGWVPATSGNFSVRMAANLIFITGSGLDKGRLTPEGLLQIDLDGKVLSGDGKPSAETALHLVIYRDRPEVRAILHVHTIWNTLLSARRAGRGFVLLTNYELLKALSGVKTHEHKEQVPILENSQDYTSLSQALEKTLAEYPSAHGVLLSGHGFYTWGTSVTDAHRHLEALEFLFEVEERRLSEGR